ncbi:MAG: hypothetical protein OHK0039_06850 [Bacteroidia bacterium]
MPSLLRSVLALALLAATLPAQGWGFWAHQRINRLAVFTLPPEMLALYKANIEYLTEHAVDPDKRRYAVDGEAARHYIDIDRYGTWPFPDLPRDWDSAVAAFTEDTLQAYGIVPYHLPRAVYQLKAAFEAGDLERILKVSADLGHYVGDAHVPLHTTENYNGQLTGQKGIHGFWESRLPELFATQYDFFVGRSFYVDDIHAAAWTFVLDSHRALDSVLGFERELNAAFPPDRKYGYESRGNVVMRVYSRDYAAAYHDRLDGMVERRMQQAIRFTGSLWYTAWKLADSPDLAPLLDRTLEISPQEYERKLRILDREAMDLGWNGSSYPDYCCIRPQDLVRPPLRPRARAFGLAQPRSRAPAKPSSWQAWLPLLWSVWV